ncbi:MAG: ComEC/Rec2 family competence protein [Parachlamydiaceae bacterium]|nr:ComEC/Rec2 family competence protein [Parachlamydiaceae bacterium]
MNISIDDFLQALTRFWRQHPGMLYGLAFLLGCAFSLQPHIIFLTPLFLITSPFLLKKTKKEDFLRFGLALLMFIAAFCYVKVAIKFPENNNQKELHGEAYFEIESFSSVLKHYGNAWRYTGKIRTFIVNNKIVATNIAATIQLAANLLPPPPSGSYIIQGSLLEVAPQRFSLNPDKNLPWIPVSGTFSLAKFRFDAKQAVGTYIRTHIQDQRSANFLVGIATGDFQDRLMAYEFGRFGLLHIMAISGFHFAIVATILNAILTLIFPRQCATLLLLFLLTVYFIFLGCGPSILRAWMTAIIVLFSVLIERKSNGINSLGIALLVLLIYDPLFSLSMGFQFSFVATAAILMLYPVGELLLQSVFLKRSLSQALQMDSLNQHAYTFLNWCRHTIALTIAVNSVALPLTLFYFQKFPVMGLFYNLFFPFMVSLSMTLLLIGSMLGLIFEPLGDIIHGINDKFTHFMLSYVHDIPTALESFWRVSTVSIEIVVCCLCVAFVFGILAFYYAESRRAEIDDWAFV